MRRAQILLITVMVLATIMTIALSVSFQSITETQVSKLEEENKKALAAAEAAIEAAIQSGGNVIIGEGALSSITGFEGSATFSSEATNSFMTNKVLKNNGYTFYLTSYDPENKLLSSNQSQNESITLCYESGTPNPSLEVTIIKTNGIKKYMIDGDSRITNALSPSSSCPNNSSFSYYYTIPGADIGTDAKLMIVHLFHNSSRLLISRTSDFPLQGNTISSTAKSTTGVSKKIELFQTYPQVPASFFSTSF